MIILPLVVKLFMDQEPFVSRHLEKYFRNNPDNLSKMVFVAGPRQVGKTTLLGQLAQELGLGKVVHLNWDRREDQIPIRDIHSTFFKELVANAGGTRPLILFDEIHKYPKWKNFLKGYYDTFGKNLATFVTGSARLDIYRRGGDSLLGRYWLFRLYPFTLSESIGRMWTCDVRTSYSPI